MTQLELAARWIVQMGKKAEMASGRTEEGKEFPALRIHHGAYVVMAFQPPELEGALILRANASFPPSLRASIGRQTEDLQRQLSIGLRQALQSSDRTGFAFMPPTAVRITDVTGFYAEQVVRVDESDEGSFNRLADAVQELVIVLTRATGIFIPLIGPQGTIVGRADPSDTGYMFR